MNAFQARRRFNTQRRRAWLAREADIIFNRLASLRQRRYYQPSLSDEPQKAGKSARWLHIAEGRGRLEADEVSLRHKQQAALEKPDLEKPERECLLYHLA